MAARAAARAAAPAAAAGGALVTLRICGQSEGHAPEPSAVPFTCSHEAHGKTTSEVPAIATNGRGRKEVPHF